MELRFVSKFLCAVQLLLLTFQSESHGSDSETEIHGFQQSLQDLSETYQETLIQKDIPQQQEQQQQNVINKENSGSTGMLQNPAQNWTLGGRAGKPGQTTDSGAQKAWPPWETLQQEDIKTDLDRLYYQKYWFLPVRSKDCDKIPAPSLDYTLVTVLIDLKREEWPHFKRQFIKYLYYAVQMLNLHAPMVIFVDDSAVDFVQYHRQGKEHLTQIIPVSIRDLEYYKDYDRIRDIMESDQFKDGHPLLHHPEGFSVDYNILMNSKLSMLFHATIKDYFSTHYFYWMDVGYGHGEAVYPKTCLWYPNAIMKGVNQITYIRLNPLQLLTSIDDLYKKFLPPFLNGAFFGGPKVSIKRYYFLNKEVFEKFLEAGKVDDDQTLAVACYFERPMLFNIVKGWWYDAFTLFA